MCISLQISNWPDSFVLVWIMKNLMYFVFIQSIDVIMSKLRPANKTVACSSAFASSLLYITALVVGARKLQFWKCRCRVLSATFWWCFRLPHLSDYRNFATCMLLLFLMPRVFFLVDFLKWAFYYFTFPFLLCTYFLAFFWMNFVRKPWQRDLFYFALNLLLHGVINRGLLKMAES